MPIIKSPAPENATTRMKFLRRKYENKKMVAINFAEIEK